jgi:hypothetical protein
MIRYAILEAPSNLGLRSTGVENSPTTLLELGLGRRLSARCAGRVAPSFPLLTFSCPIIDEGAPSLRFLQGWDTTLPLPWGSS